MTTRASVVSWNVLAPEHASWLPPDRPEFYRHTREWVPWHDGVDRIAARLVELDADVAA
jgi:hypothetical protein